VEFRATKTDIETIERDGFPDAEYLEVQNGNLVFACGQKWLSKTGGRRELFQLTVPVVSDRLLASWTRSMETDGPIDLSALRLVAVFRGEDVRARWPELAKQAVEEKSLDEEPVKMSLVGDTVVASGQLGLPTFSGVRSAAGKAVDWEQVRRLGHGVHFQSPGRLLRNFLLGAALLALSYFLFRHHRRNPTKPPPGGLDLTPLTDGSLDL
jgi:hypothetical protein